MPSCSMSCHSKGFYSIEAFYAFSAQHLCPVFKLIIKPLSTQEIQFQRYPPTQSSISGFLTSQFHYLFNKSFRISAITYIQSEKLVFLHHVSHTATVHHESQTFKGLIWFCIFKFYILQLSLPTGTQPSKMFYDGVSGFTHRRSCVSRGYNKICLSRGQVPDGSWPVFCPEWFGFRTIAYGDKILRL